MQRKAEAKMKERASFMWVVAVVVVLLYGVAGLPISCPGQRDAALSQVAIPDEMVSSRQANCVQVAPLPASAEMKAALGQNCLAVTDAATIFTGVFKDILKDIGSVDKNALKIIDNILKPIEVAIKIKIQYMFDEANDNICLGNFMGGDLKPEIELDRSPMMYNKCKDMPVSKYDEWSIFAFALTAPNPMCLTEKGTAAFCFGVSVCQKTGLPSVAFLINSVAQACFGENVSMTDGGVSAAGSKLFSYGLDYISYGISLSQGLATKLTVYTASDKSSVRFITYAIKGNYYDAVKVKVKLEKFSLPAFLDLSGTSTRILSVNGLQDIDFSSAIASFPGGEDSDGFSNDILDFFESFTNVRIQAAQIYKLKLKFKFSKLKIGKILPDSNSMTIAEANVFLTTHKIQPSPYYEEDGVVLPAGFYMYIGSDAIASIMKGMITYFLQFTSSTLNLLGSWAPFNFDAKELVDKLKFDTEDGFAMGLTANVEQFGMVMHIPLIIKELGYITLECRSDYNSFKCRVESGFNVKFFVAAAKEIASGTMWVINESDSFFNEVGRVLSIGFDDGIDELESVFSESNVKKTANMIGNGVLDVGNDAVDEFKSWGRWCKTVYNDVEDILSAKVNQGVKTVASTGKKAVDEAYEALKKAKDAIEDTYNSVGNELTCTIGQVEASTSKEKSSSVKEKSSSFKKKRRLTCTAIDVIADAYNTAERNVAKGWETIRSGTIKYTQVVGDAFYSKKVSYSYKTLDPAQYDVFNCRLRKVYKVKKKQVLGKTVNKDKKYIGDEPEEECVKGKYQKTVDALLQQEDLDELQDRYDEVMAENADALFASEMTVEDLINDGGFECTSELSRDNPSPDSEMMGVRVVCSARSIGNDGSFSGPFVSISRSGEVDNSDYIAREDAIEALYELVKEELVQSMTPYMLKAKA
ncbi:hypothetical protein NDN08_001935 [Rhodosorus marinus]|uniref:Uncharacterized protein n=1 Tax=Rhodosorus marinus TaxID=101924 RepID=A0AAV8UV34_9RHOD|nr:hypothetical protein NDN08_001935 [Rhodosorus marinus]